MVKILTFLDYSECGQAGDVGSVNELANLSRTIGGTDATSLLWPWQVTLSRRVTTRAAFVVILL